jgi:wyosine [tRNA(Phe)-imidazoG37] synthetase (radical SAM superfamily)
MPTIIPLQDSVVYGPIRSRRLGSSLGLNILPTSHKACSSNCVYCQYGWTTTPKSPERLKRAAELLADIEASFAAHAREGTPVDCITFAGNGEPTIHPDFLQLAQGVLALRDRYFPSARVGVLSDATQVTKPSVRLALQLLDDRYMKFDAADEATWKRINQPLAPVDFAAMVQGLRELSNIVLQSMFVQGSYDNTDVRHVDAWVEAVRSINPRSVQVYTVDRGTAAEGITEVPRGQLQAIADRLTLATGIPTEVYD